MNSFMPANEEARHRLLFITLLLRAWIDYSEPLIHCAHSTKLEQTNKGIIIKYECTESGLWLTLKNRGA